jgi:hypothetical protein
VGSDDAHPPGALQQEQYPDCIQLARDLEAVPRTVQGDVDFIGDLFGFDVERQAVRTYVLGRLSGVGLTEGT